MIATQRVPKLEVLRASLLALTLLAVAGPAPLQAFPANILEGITGAIFNTFNTAVDKTARAFDLGNGFIGSSANCTAAAGPSASSSCLPWDPDASRDVPEIIRSRGFKVEEHDVITLDGYILTVHRVVNPLVDAARRRRLKPVILQHGLMSSSVDWVINSVDVRPRPFPRKSRSKPHHPSQHQQQKQSPISTSTAWSRPWSKEMGRWARPEGASLPHHELDSPDHPNSLAFYLANEGYDCWLANSRGNVYAQRHVNISTWSPRFWDFSYDEQIKYDLPATLEYIQRKTDHQKVGYVGHSQGTAMILGLLSDRPEYADVFEPVVMLAPVAFVGHVTTPAKVFAYSTPVLQHVDMWFGSSNAAIRLLAPIVCGPKVIRKELCSNLIFLSSGFDESEFNDTRLTAYLTHTPSGTSVQNLAHWGQQVLNHRFSHFDYGVLENRAHYGQAEAPDYNLGRIRSKSLVFFTSENDWLAQPKDVAKLMSKLRVRPYRTYNMSMLQPKWGHTTFLYGKDSGRLVNTRILEVLNEFHLNKNNQGSDF